MASPSWSPTQQVRALLLLHELAALLAGEARARTLHGHPQVAAQLEAVGKRGLPQALSDMADWSALRLAGGREPLRTAIGQFTGSAAWAERVTGDVLGMLRQGERFNAAALQLDDLAKAIALADGAQTQRGFDVVLASMHQHRDAHTQEDQPAAQASWGPCIELLRKSAAALGLNPAPPPPMETRHSASAAAGGRPLANSSTPYQPSSAIEPGTGTGGSHALRRRR